MLKGRFTNPVSDGISGFVSKGIKYLEKEIYYFPFNIAPSSEYFLKLDGSTKLRNEYPLIEKDYSSPDPNSLAKNNFPSMTSNTTPAPYVAKAKIQPYAEHSARLAFSSQDGYYSSGANGKVPLWVELQTGAKWLLTSYSITVHTASDCAYPIKWDITGYKDTSYSDPRILDNRENETFGPGQTKLYELLNPLKLIPTKIFRINILESFRSIGQIRRLIFYTITEEQYNTIKNSFVLPNLINYEDSIQGYICLREHVTTYK